MDRGPDEQMDRQRDGHTNRQTDRLKDGQRDRWIVGQTNLQWKEEIVNLYQKNVLLKSTFQIWGRLVRNPNQILESSGTRFISYWRTQVRVLQKIRLTISKSSLYKPVYTPNLPRFCILSVILKHFDILMACLQCELYGTFSNVQSLKTVSRTFDI